MKYTIPLIVATLALISSAPAVAQDQFGRAVATTASDVLVLKPAAGRGPATVFVFRREGGAWQSVRHLRSAGAIETGEGFSQSLSLAGNTLMVGSGDPNTLWGAQVYRVDNDGLWADGGRIPIQEVDAAGAANDQIDLGTVMRILQPPQRIVATDGDVTLVSVVGAPVGLSGVRVFRVGGSNAWVEEARLDAPRVTSRDRFGAAVAVRGNRALVGAPRSGGTGAVFVFGRDPSSGVWDVETTLLPDSASGDSAFGASVGFHNDAAMVGAPGTRGSSGSVTFLSRDADSGAWRQTSRLVAPNRAAGDFFGAAFAMHEDELAIGSPGADGSRGAVYSYARMDAAWRLAQTPTASDTEPGWLLGSSVALNGDVLVAGAPGADGGAGRTAVFTRDGEDSWSDPVWLSAGGDLAAVSGEEVRCTDGEAAHFECSNVDLLSFLPTSALGGGPAERVSDIWGWTDPETGREYALVGRSGGAAFVDVTNPTSPEYLGVMHANRSGARDIKVYADHMFLTGDGAGDHGLLVFDLARLRGVVNPPVDFEPDAKYDSIASAHNLIIDTGAGFAYPVGASGGGETCGGGLHMVDIREPQNPKFAGCYTDTEGLIWAGRTHDGQCVIYDGPDEKYQDREICFASNETALRIVDVTEKSSPVPLSAATYPGMAYVHQGWLTDDKRYFYLDDELDELVGQADRTRTLVWDVAELEDPVLVGEFLGPDGATDHNLYVKGDRMYQANYQAGFRIIDISDPENPVEIGYFDTTPYEGNPPGFNGAWTAYPYFESGTVIVSSMYEGLFLLKPASPELVP